MNEITVGTKVRSFDFECHDLTGERACFVEGTVVGFAEKDGCERYAIHIERAIFGGKKAKPHTSHIYPPKNGTSKLFGGECNGVEVVESAEAH